MHPDRDRIQDHLERVRGRIAAAAERAGRDPSEVRLVAVTKAVGLEEVEILLEQGVTDFGENRLDASREKLDRFGGEAVWHFIGPIQRRKARDIAALYDWADAVDRVKVAETLERRCEEQGKRLAVFVEVNVAGEENKHGFAPENVGEAVGRLRELPHLDVAGLMGMAPWYDEPEDARPVFATLRELAREQGLRGLSMGMTNDFEVAVEEGATQVRIGSALFE
jgi:hypothetical protein